MGIHVKYSTLLRSMRILIVTPLYPPDIAPQAVYVKEFAKRYAAYAEITILAYAHIPEAIDGVTSISVPKDRPLFLRLLHFTWALWRAAKMSDLLFIQNGASVELPASIVSFFVRIPRIVMMSDISAYASGENRALLQKIQNLLLRRATHMVYEKSIVPKKKWLQKSTILSLPKDRPEIISFKPYPTQDFLVYEEAWKQHLEALTHIFTYGK